MMTDASLSSRLPGPPFTFLSNHAHVLIELANDPDVLLRNVAERVGITERAVQRIVAELEEAEILRRYREGRCNHYEIDRSQPLRHSIEQHCTVGDLLDMVLSADASKRQLTASAG